MDGKEPKVTWDDVDRALEHRDKNELDLVQMDQTMKVVFYGSLKEFKEHFMQDDPVNTGRPRNESSWPAPKTYEEVCEDFKRAFLRIFEQPQNILVNNGNLRQMFTGEAMKIVEEIISGGLSGDDGLGTIDDLRRFSAVVDSDPPKSPKAKGKKKGGKWWINNKYGRFAK